MSLRPMPITVPIFEKASGLIANIWRVWFRDAATAIGGSAPIDAAYLTATADATLTAPRNLGLLTSGYLKVAVALGIATPSTSATVPAADLTGTIADARFPATLPAVSGAALTGLLSTQLGDVSSSTYTPILTNSVNVAASTAYSCQYLKVGSVVTVSGQVDVDPTAAGDTQLGISLPVASNFANANECGGCAAAPGIAGQSAGILADAANNRATLQWTAVDVTNQAWRFSFSYRII